MAYEFNPFTGKFDITRPDNFSYELVPLGSTVKIPVNQQMIVHDTLTVDGTLTTDGTLVIL